MAFLNAQREKLAAMSVAADVSAQAAQAMNLVHERMRRIEELETAPIKKQGPDEEVEMWRRKIAQLSQGGPGPIGDKPPPPVRRASTMRDGAKARRSNNDMSRGTQSKSVMRKTNPVAGAVRKKVPRSAVKELSPSTKEVRNNRVPRSSSYNDDHHSGEGRSNRRRVGGSRVGSGRVASKPSTTPPKAPPHPLVADVESRIKGMSKQPLAPDPEVEFWRKKIADLTAVNPTKGYTPPKHTGASDIFSPSHPRGSALDAARRRARSSRS